MRNHVINLAAEIDLQMAPGTGYCTEGWYSQRVRVATYRLAERLGSDWLGPHSAGWSCGAGRSCAWDRTNRWLSEATYGLMDILWVLV
jgi:hypothetical protein